MVLGDGWPCRLGYAQKGADHSRIELGTRTFADDLDARLEGGSPAIGPVRGNGIEGVGHGEDSGAWKNFIALEAAGIALAIVPLVMSKHEFGRVSKKGNVCNQIEADLNVALHEFSFIRRERPGLEENAVWD